jgi:hypothetical protein
VDGYRLAIGDDTGGDEIRLQYIVNGAVSSTVITSSGSLTNNLTDIGFLVQVTRSSAGAWALSTSTLPTTNGTGAIASAVPNSTNASVSQGSGTNNSLAPATNNFLGVAALHSSGASGIAGAEFDQIYFTATSSGPTITATGTPGAAPTTYGAASPSPTSFSISGANMTAGISVNPPANFQVSTVSDFSSNTGTNGSPITVGAAGTISSTTIYVRLLPTAPVTGSPHSGNIALTSSGATLVNVATTSSSVTAKPLTIIGLTGTAKVYTGTTAASFTGTAAYSGLANSESFSVTGTPVASFSTAAVGTSKSITITGYTAPSTNYSLTQPSLSANITAAPLTVTADDVTKPFGNTLTTPVIGSTAFTSSGLVNSETIGSVTITYGSGAAASDAANTYTDQVVPSAATGGSFSAANYAITYAPGDIIVSASPLISFTGTVAARTTSIGTPSASASVAVSGSNLTADITATAPSTDFEVSSNDTVWGPTATFTESGGAASGTLYIRLSAAAPVSSPAGNVVLSTTGATSQNVAVSGTVFKAEPTNHATGLAAGTITTTNIPAAWTAASPAPDGYLLKVSSGSVADPVDGTDPADVTDVSGGSAQVKITPGSAASFSGFTGFAAGSTYTFALFPYNNSGTNINFKTASAPSFSAVLLPAAPTTPTFTSVSATGFTVNWTAVTGATDYRLDVATDSGFTSIVSGYSDLTVASNNQAVTGLAPNTAYHVRVRAVNASGTSANSTTASQTTAQLTAPVAIAATNEAPTGFTANWNAVSGATGYRLDVYSGTTAVTAPDLFFSEYIEGTSNNKYIEIYNGTGADVTLSDYQVRLYANGASSPNNTQNLGSLPSGPTTLANGATLLLKNSQAALTLPSGVTAYSSTVANYGGNDALALYKISTTSFIDYFGSVGNDPGTSWTDGEISTINKTLRRKTTVTAGLTTNPAATFPTLATEWDQFDIDTVSELGAHTSDANGIAATALLSGFDNLDVGNVTTYAVTGASAETEYSYVVRATSANSTSANSNEIDVTTIAETAEPTITSDGSVATAFTTPYGTPSEEQSFAISGAGLSEDLTATAPTGFEVSFDGTSYGSTATFTPSSGTASGSLRIRLAATALVSGNYNSKDIVLSSSGATSVNITTASSGNVVSKATPTIATAPTASGITFGQTLADSNLTDGEASTGGIFAFTTPSTAPNAGTASQEVTFTPTDGDNYNNASTTVSVTTSKATPTITTAPTASGITFGETLASSSLTGGLASTDGTFAFTTPGTSPAVGTANQGVTFTPTDTGNYNNAITTVSVTVSSGSDPLFTTVGNSPTITFAAGAANIAFSGIPGRTYGIERSATLTDWTQIDTVTADSVSGAATYRDSSPLLPAAFYRIVYPPAGN